MLICPRCLKKNTLTPYMGTVFGKFLCKSCGYMGVFIIEESEQNPKRKSPKK